MNPNIYIQSSANLRLLPVNQEHLSARYLAWLNNQEIVKYSELRHSKHTYESCLQYWQSFQNKPHLFLAIEVNEGQQWQHIGNINAYVDEKNKVADIGILIGERGTWGKGYGTKAWQALCHYLFEQRQIRKITAGTMSINQGMLKIIQKTGMVEDGKRIRQYICDDQEVDICHFALFNTHWKIA